MRLKRLREDWERLAEHDAYWAVLSDPAKRGGKWDVDAFYASGQAEIDYVMSYAGALRPDLARGDALDFGCGPGRLTYALAAHFSHAVGVDISAPMIELAERRRGTVQNCDFICNDRDDLSVLLDASFDFVYSRIVLQHMPAALALGYVSEFVRILRPGGLALFQIPEPLLSPLAQARRGLSHLLRGASDDAKTIRMFGVPRAEVSRQVSAAGGRLLNVAADGSAGAGTVGWLYAVVPGSQPTGPAPGPIPEWQTPP
ncbi:MAG TPA: class I SAM-dependent methyltransferase [Mycobacteriales bacterium]|nr:class I SAM-dependent methyltransferase [Mycobacteriales bacterium]